MSSTSRQMWNRPSPRSAIHLLVPEFGLIRLQQLEVGFAHREHGQRRGVRRQMLLVLHGDAELVGQHVLDRVHVLEGDGDVLDALDLHACSCARCLRGTDRPMIAIAGRIAIRSALAAPNSLARRRLLDWTAGGRIRRQVQGPEQASDHEDHRRPFALGHAARLSAADGQGACPAAGHLELGDALSHRGRDGGAISATAACGPSSISAMPSIVRSTRCARCTIMPSRRKPRIATSSSATGSTSIRSVRAPTASGSCGAASTSRSAFSATPCRLAVAAGERSGLRALL